MSSTTLFIVRAAILYFVVALITTVTGGENPHQLERENENPHTLKRVPRAVHLDFSHNPNNGDHENNDEFKDEENEIKNENEVENESEDRQSDPTKDRDEDNDDGEVKDSDDEEIENRHSNNGDPGRNPEDEDEYMDDDEDNDEETKITKSLHESIEKIAREVVDEIRKRWKRQHVHKKDSSHFDKHHDDGNVDDNKIEIIKDGEEHKHHNAIGRKNENDLKKGTNQQAADNIKQTKTLNTKAIETKKNPNAKLEKENNLDTGLKNDMEKQTEVHEKPAKKVSFVQSIHFQPNYKYKIEANKKDNEQVAGVEYEPDEIKTAKSDSEAKNVLYKALSVETTNSNEQRLGFGNNKNGSLSNGTLQNDGDVERVFGLNQFQFVIIIVACCVTALVAFIVTFICWYKLETNMKQRKGKRGSFKATPTEKNLAEGAEVFHYMTIKKVLQELEPKNSPDEVKCMDVVESSDTSDAPESSDNDEVLSCAGLVIPDNLNVVNPIFSDSDAFYSNPVSLGGSSNPSAHEREADSDVDEFLYEKEDEIEGVEKKAIVVEKTINNMDMHINTEANNSINTEDIKMGKESVNDKADMDAVGPQAASEPVNDVKNNINAGESQISADSANDEELVTNTGNSENTDLIADGIEHSSDIVRDNIENMVIEE